MVATLAVSQGLAVGLGIAGGLLALLLLVLAVRFIFFGRVAIKKSANDLHGRYERSHALLFGNDSQYLTRLESISGMNLTYVGDYQKWKKTFTEIRDIKDADALRAINQLADTIGEGRYRDAKEQLPEVRKLVDDFEKAVSELNAGLSAKFADEDACKSLILNLQEQLRNLRTAFAAKANDLQLVTASFSKMYAKIENLISEANELVDDAKYAEAKQILEKKIGPVLKALSDSFEGLPDTCITLTRLLPDKIEALEERYRDLSAKGYPLGHLLASDEIARMKKEVQELSDKTARYELRGVSEEVKRLLDKIERIGRGFDGEISAKEEFQRISQESYKLSDAVSEKYLDLRQAMPKIHEIYVITPKAEEEFNLLSGAVSESAATKRNLDTYVHSAAKQPYSILLEKSRSLLNQSEDAKKALDSFQDYLASLKKGAEDSSRALASYYMRTKNAESVLRALNCEKLSGKYKPLLDNEFDMLDSLYGVLKKTPIDVEKAVDIKASVVDNGEKCIGEIEQLDEARLEAEKAIVIANRNRHNYPGAEDLLEQAETFYFSGDYVRAAQSAGSVSKLRPTDRQ